MSHASDLVQLLRNRVPMQSCDTCREDSACFVACGRGDCSHEGKLMEQAADELEKRILTPGRGLLSDIRQACMQMVDPFKRYTMSLRREQWDEIYRALQSASSETAPLSMSQFASKADYDEAKRSHDKSSLQTPRTDAWLKDRAPKQVVSTWGDVVALAEFARELERELTEAKKWRGVMTEIADKNQQRVAELEAAPSATQRTFVVTPESLARCEPESFDSSLTVKEQIANRIAGLREAQHLIGEGSARADWFKIEERINALIDGSSDGKGDSNGS